MSMTPAGIVLWEKIKIFQLDDPQVAFTFSDRVARENGWSKTYSLRVIEEYRKFIFLCCVCADGTFLLQNHPSASEVDQAATGITPSDPVDQVWHLHLTFTKSYWTDFCQNTLGKEMHHNPTKGGSKEAVKFNNFYTHTRTLYIAQFDEEPPADIWQSNKKRFGDINFKRINLNHYWLVKKPGRFMKRQIVTAALIVIGLTAVQSNTQFLPVVIIGAVSLLVVSIIVNNNSRKGTKNDGDAGTSGCSVADGGHHTHSDSSDAGDGSGCSGCSGSGCSGCGGGD